MTSARPYVICHMMSSIDGKIATGIPNVELLDEYFVTYTKTEDQLNGRAWMCGRVTMEMFASGKSTPLSLAPKEILIKDTIFDNNAETYLIGVDTKGILRWNSNEVQLTNVPKPSHLIIVVTQKTPPEYLAYLKEKKISYIFSGESEVNLSIVLEKLKQQFSIEKLLLEGGGILNGYFVADNLIDEVSLLLCPIVANKSNAPAVFETQTNTLDVKKFKLTAFTQQKNDTVWLRYIATKL